MFSGYGQLCLLLLLFKKAACAAVTVSVTEKPDIPLGFQRESQSTEDIFSSSEGKLVAEDKNICMQGVTKGSTYGYIRTPFYPGIYPNNLTCLWSVTAPKGFVIQLLFRDFQLEEGHDGISCPYDYLHIFEEYRVVFDSPRNPLDPGVTYRRNFGTYCGDRKPTEKVTKKPGSTLYLFFHSDDSEGRMGFSASYRMLDTKRSTNTDLEISDEENFIRVLFLVLSLFVMIGVFVGFIYRCTSNSNDFYYFDRDSNDGFRMPNDVEDRVVTRRGRVSPELIGPPPAYTEVVKTEEDWNRVVDQLGAASVAVLRRRVEAELIQVEYDIMNSDSTSNNQEASQSASNAVSNTTTNVSERSEITQAAVHLETTDETEQTHEDHNTPINQDINRDSSPSEVTATENSAAEDSSEVNVVENPQVEEPEVCSPKPNTS